MAALDNFRNHLRRLRGDDKNFVTNVANNAGVSRALVNGWLNNKGEPGIETAEKVAKALGASLADFIGKERPALAPSLKPSPEEILEIFIRGSEISDERKKYLCRLVRATPEEWNGVLPSLRALSDTPVKGKKLTVG